MPTTQLILDKSNGIKITHYFILTICFINNQCWPEIESKFNYFAHVICLIREIYWTKVTVQTDNNKIFV